MGEFAALEAKVEAIEIPRYRVMVVVMRWRMAGGGRASVVFRLHFILYAENERDGRR